MVEGCMAKIVLLVRKRATAPGMMPGAVVVPGVTSPS